ncbi:hypothetical protein MAPG_07601 [Magnaporthiopsis poae ATCC 64411]|uniref:Uncharacterized protein n=1 Tax=Magnaporthiopsis poae (strain ATCC 64411 / 73-15) TaxID=644358 RepID=A0A0C4E540_MAGP6|nr:hypothetical protein MAPG_07601 [Magnaporthiopsis poae ATCC 64411]
MSEIHLDTANDPWISHQRAEEILDWIGHVVENSTRAGAEHEHQDELVPLPSASLIPTPSAGAGAGPGSLTMPQSTSTLSTPPLRTDRRRFGILSPKEHQSAWNNIWGGNGN